MTSDASKKAAKAAAAKQKREEDGANQDVVNFLLEGELPTDTVDLIIRGVGVRFVVRGLSRDETIEVGRFSEGPEFKRDGEAGYEAKMLSYGLVDPAMTYEEIRRWQKSSPGMQIQELSEKVNELSGLTKEVRKDITKSAVG